MALVDQLVNLALDSKRIAAIAPARGAGRWPIWRTDLRLTLALQSSQRNVDHAVLRYRMRCLDRTGLAQLFREIFVNRFYDVPLTSVAPTIIDCGSNIGMSILFFKDLYPQAKIIGIEPNPLAFAVLRENVERNAFSDVVLHQKALTDRPGTVQFFVYPNLPGALNAGLFAGSTTNAITVQADRLSDYIDSEVDLVKLDVEGAEGLILQDLAQHDKLSHVRNIVIEFHHHHRRDRVRDDLSVTLGILENAGFRYQIGAHASHPWRLHYQDVMIYACRA